MRTFSLAQKLTYQWDLKVFYEKRMIIVISLILSHFLWSFRWHKKSKIRRLILPYSGTSWWRTTPVATKTRYHGAGGALLRARIYQFLHYELLTRTCSSGSSFISSLPFRLLDGFFPFQDPIREASPSLWTLFLSMSMLGVGCGPQVGPFPSRPIMGSIRGEGTPPQTLAVIWRKVWSPSQVAAQGRPGKESNRHCRRRCRRRTPPCRRRRDDRHHSLPQPRVLLRCHCNAAVLKPPPQAAAGAASGLPCLHPLLQFHLPLQSTFSSTISPSRTTPHTTSATFPSIFPLPGEFFLLPLPRSKSRPSRFPLPDFTLSSTIPTSTPSRPSTRKSTPDFPFPVRPLSQLPPPRLLPNQRTSHNSDCPPHRPTPIISYVTPPPEKCTRRSPSLSLPHRARLQFLLSLAEFRSSPTDYHRSSSPPSKFARNSPTPSQHFLIDLQFPPPLPERSDEPWIPRITPRIQFEFPSPSTRDFVLSDSPLPPSRHLPAGPPLPSRTSPALPLNPPTPSPSPEFPLPAEFNSEFLPSLPPFHPTRYSSSVNSPLAKFHCEIHSPFPSEFARVIDEFFTLSPPKSLSRRTRYLNSSLPEIRSDTPPLHPPPSFR